MTTVPSHSPKVIANPNCTKCHGTGMKKSLLGNKMKECGKCKKDALRAAACNKCGDTGLLLKDGKACTSCDMGKRHNKLL